MLEIRNPQLDPLVDPPLVTFAERLCAFFSRDYRWLLSGLDEAERIDRIARAVRVALEWGIATEWDLCRFAALELQVGPDFGRPQGPAWALEILSDDANTGRGKADALEHKYYYVLGNDPRGEVG